MSLVKSAFNEIVYSNVKGQLVTNSLMLSEEFSKDHDKVIRDIKTQISKLREAGEQEFINANFGDISYFDNRNRKQNMIELTEDGFAIVAMSYITPKAMKLKVKFISEFKRLREQVKEQSGLIDEIKLYVKNGNQLSLDEFNKKRFSVGRTIKTFEYADMNDYDSLIDDFNLYISNLDTKTRIKRCDSAINGIERRIKYLANESVGNIGHCYNLQQHIISIKSMSNMIENRRNGGQKAALKKENNKLNKKMRQLEPDFEDYYMINYAPISENNLYEDDLSSPTGKRKTKVYRRWLENFPYDELPYDPSIDWSKPIRIYLGFTHKERCDLQNLHKGIIDTLFKHYGYDDYIVEEMDVKSKRLGTVKTHRDGKIYWLLRNC